MNKPWAIRDFVPADTNFIMATFLRGLYYGDSWFSLMPKDLFMLNYKKVAEALLASPKVTIKIACLKDDYDVILGYSILGPDGVVHWVQVKKDWRNIGIAKSLMPDQVKAVTHLSELGRQLLNKLPNCVFNPFSINL